MRTFWPGRRKAGGILCFFTALFTLAACGQARAEGRILVLSDADEAAYRAGFEALDRRDIHASDAAFLSVSDPVLLDLARARRMGAADPALEGGARRALPGAAPAIAGDTQAAREAIEATLMRLSEGDWAGARSLAEAQIHGPRAGQAEHSLGLIAFHARQYEAAARHFEAASHWRPATQWERSSAFYWAGRARLAAGDAKQALAHFRAALAYPATFYGQLAEAQLGRDSGLRFTPPRLGAEQALAFLLAYPNARRAAALAQIGRLSDVEIELRALHAKIKPSEDRLFLDFADALAAPSAQLRAAEYGGPNEGWGYCPTMTFAPEDGFRIDRAALYAVTRQESRFSPVAISTSNARGLMQLLPSTASDMDKSKPFRAAPDLLHEPGLNMRLGQKYLEWLMSGVAKDGDLAKAFAAYNGGPGWLSRWLQSAPHARDPLLMIETLPRAETRDYAERVLAHMSLCRKKLRQEPAEMAALASGQPALYRKLDR